MTKKTEKIQSVHDKAIRLLEGGLVEIDGLIFSIDDAVDDDNPCLGCNLDSICSENIKTICNEADMITQSLHRMILH